MNEAQAPGGRILLVEDDPSLASGLASGLARAGFTVTVCLNGEQALAAVRRGAMIDPPMRILIVEDDSTLGSGVLRILQAEGYAVDLMPRGEQAVLAAERERFDLVILDVGLPGIDGFEVLRRLREGAQRMPVLVLTARDTVDDRVHGLDLGADDYMAKPFAMPELAARVRALIRRSQAQSGPRVVHGPLALDTVARRAFLRGAPLDLAAREWAVLEVLLARVERIVSKESIIQAVASWGDELSPNAIEVYVSRLRAKLEPAGIRIRTVRGFGYMLEEYAEAQ
jgi:two-component system OmpR family response regulator